LRSQAGFQLWEHLDADVEFNSWETIIRKNARTPAKESLGYYEGTQQKTWFEEINNDN
jgi:hypothetical protein